MDIVMPCTKCFQLGILGQDLTRNIFFPQSQEHLVHDHGYCIWCCFSLQLSHILLKWFIWVFQEGMVTEPTMWPWLWPHSWLSLSWSNFEVAMFQEWEGRLTLNERDGGLSFMTMTLTIWWRTWSVRIYWTVTGVTLDQRCVVRGMALSSLLSCRLLANLNSRGSPVAPTWAHLCWPGSRSVHGSIHSCVIRQPRFARRGHPRYCLGCLARSRRPPSVNKS